MVDYFHLKKCYYNIRTFWYSLRRTSKQLPVVTLGVAVLFLVLFFSGYHARFGFTRPNRDFQTTNGFIIPSTPFDTADSNLFIQDFKQYIKKARKKCKYIPLNIASEEWPTPKISVKYSKFPPFLPEYKNPCWWSSGKDGDEGTTLKCMPYFYLAGFPKCGTSDLYYRLNQHPHVIGGKGKEPQYFTRKMYPTPCLSEKSSLKEQTECLVYGYLDRYYKNSTKVIQRGFKEREHIQSEEGLFMDRESFKRRNHSIVAVDGSADFIWDNSKWREIAENRGCREPAFGPIHVIRRLNPAVRIIVLLRDPVDRLYSDYSFHTPNPSPDIFHRRVKSAIVKFRACTAEGKPLHSCHPVIKAGPRLTVGLYHRYITEWLRVVPHSQMLILHSETYHKNIAATLARVFAFLDLPSLSKEKLDAISGIGERHVTKKKEKMGDMLPETEEILRDFYAEHNQELAELLQDQRFLWTK